MQYSSTRLYVSSTSVQRDMAEAATNNSGGGRWARKIRVKVPNVMSCLAENVQTKLLKLSQQLQLPSLCFLLQSVLSLVQNRTRVWWSDNTIRCSFLLRRPLTFDTRSSFFLIKPFQSVSHCFGKIQRWDWIWETGPIMTTSTLNWFWSFYWLASIN